MGFQRKEDKTGEGVVDLKEVDRMTSVGTSALLLGQEGQIATERYTYHGQRIEQNMLETPWSDGDHIHGELRKAAQVRLAYAVANVPASKVAQVRPLLHL